MPSSRLTALCAAGGHGVRALQDYGAREGGGGSPAPAASVPAEGRRRVSVAAADQQPEGTGAVSGEEGLWEVAENPQQWCLVQLHMKRVVVT